MDRERPETAGNAIGGGMVGGKESRPKRWAEMALSEQLAALRYEVQRQARAAESLEGAVMRLAQVATAHQHGHAGEVLTPQHVGPIALQASHRRADVLE